MYILKALIISWIHEVPKTEAPKMTQYDPTEWLKIKSQEHEDLAANGTG